MIKEILSKVGVSQAKMGRKHGVHHTMIGKVFKKSQVDCIKRKSTPKYFPSQKEWVKRAAGIFRRDFFPSSGSTNTVMDDESYFGLKDDITPGNFGFYKKSVTSVGDIPEEVRFRTKAMNPEKLLVWITISEKGISEPFFIHKKVSLAISQ